MQNTGLFSEFQIWLSENPRPEEIPEDEWTNNHPLRWKTANFLENFAAVKYEAIAQERERIDDTLMMLDVPPTASDDGGTLELASKQHSMWIAELLDNSWSDQVTSDMSAFDEETKGNGILMFYIFLREHVGYTKEAIIAAKQQLTKEKLALENFDHDIIKYTMHARTYLRQITNAGSPIMNQHFILIFSALKEASEEEFKLTIMKLYEGWRTGRGDGANISILQPLARADSEYKRLSLLQQWKTKNKSSDLLGLQAKFDTLQMQFTALAAEHTKLKTKQQQSNKPTGAPKPEEKEERVVNGKTWYYCSSCMSGRHWNKTHKSAEHKRGMGKNKNEDKSQEKQGETSHLGSFDTGYGVDFQSG